MQKLHEEFQAIISSIDQTTDLFYQQKNEDGFVKLEHLLSLLTQTSNRIREHGEEGHDIGIDVIRMNQILDEAMHALESTDMILFSDILQYELKDLFSRAAGTL